MRPVSAAEVADAAHDSDMSLDFPTAGDLLGRGLAVTVPGNLSGQAPQVGARHSTIFYSPRVHTTHLACKCGQQAVRDAEWHLRMANSWY